MYTFLILIHLKILILEMEKKFWTIWLLALDLFFGFVGFALKRLLLCLALPGSFMSALHALVVQSSAGYTDAVRKGITAGGDLCPRVMFVGAFKACQGGLDSVPKDWVSKCLVGSEVISLAEKLAALRDSK